MRQLYLTVVKPRMLYGADVFLGPTMRYESFKNRKGRQAALNKLAAIQRSTALTIVGGGYTPLLTIPLTYTQIYSHFTSWSIKCDTRQH